MLELFCWLILFYALYSAARIAVWVFGIERRYRSFPKRGIHGPKPLFILGNMLDVRFGLQHEIFEDWAKKYGETFAFHTPSKSYIVTTDLHILRTVFADSKVFNGRPGFVIKVKPLIDSILSKKGQEWQTARKAMSPPLSHSKVNSPPISTIIAECVDRFIAAINPENCQQPFVVDIGDRLNKFSLDVILRTSMDMDADVYSKDDLLTKAVREYFDGASNNAVLIAEAVPVLRPIMRLINDQITSGKMTDLMVAHLKRTVHSFLRDFGHGQKESKAVLLRALLQKLKDGILSEDEFVGNLHLMVLGGYETTASGLTSALYLLAKHQATQERLRECVKDRGHNHSYLDMVWFESLRYYPPVVGMVSREANEDTVVSGVQIDKKTIVMAPVWQIHHSDQFWPDPWTFDPERFSPENRSQHEALAFLPFGFGPKICLGMNLANAEARRILAAILTRYRVSFCEKTVDPMKFKPVAQALIKPSDPVFLKFEPINSEA